MRVKNRTVIALIAVLGIMLAACGGADSGSPGGTAATTTTSAGGTTTTAASGSDTTVGDVEPVELLIWSHWGVDPNKRQWIEEVVAEYEDEHPHVTFTIEWYGDKADLYTQFNAIGQAGGQNSPDILTVDFRPLFHIPQQQNGWLLDLSPGLDTTQWDEGLLGAATYDGGIWGLPIEAFSILMWYNRTQLSEWGFEIPDDGRISWEEFQQIAERARSEGMYVVGQGVQNITAFSAHYPMLYILNALGPDKVFDAIALGDLPYNDPEIVDALQAAVDEIPNLFNPDVATLTSTEGAQLLFSGRAAFTVEGSWLPGWMAAAEAEGAVVEGMDLGVMRFPTLPDGRGDGVVQWGAGSGWGGSVFTEHPDVVIDFFNFMSTPERGTRWIELTSVPTGMAAPAPDSVPELTGLQLAWQLDGPAISPAIYQVPFGDEEVYWREGLTRFYADRSFTAQEFLDEMQRLRESR